MKTLSDWRIYAIHTFVSLLQTDMIQQQIRFLKWNTRDKKELVQNKELFA